MATLDVVRPMEAEDLYQFLAQKLRPQIIQELALAERGQRMRVTSLPTPVMVELCTSLQGDARWEARLLGKDPGGPTWKATAAKVIELRNALDKPLLVFLPPDLRTAAEDSLDIATFTELSLAGVSASISKALLDDMPEPIAEMVTEQLKSLRAQKILRNTDDEIAYLLTVRRNGMTASAAGGALYVLGLLPDFDLFTRGNTRVWLDRNIRASEHLGDVTQPLQTRLRKLKVKPKTIQDPLFSFLRARHAENIRTWARAIACDPAHRSLALDQWEFDDADIEELRLILEPLTLPKQTEDKVTGTTPLPVLNVGDQSKDVLKIVFRSIPNPSQYPSWKTFRVQILSVESGEAAVAWESNSYTKPGGRQATIRRSIKAKDLQSLTEGTYYLKVEAYDQDGALLTQPRRIHENQERSRAENESERFLVVREEVEREEPDVRAVLTTSLLVAWVDVAVKCVGSKAREPLPDRSAVRGAWDVPVDAEPKGDVRFELTGEGFAGYAVQVPAFLRRVELTILDHPEQLGCYRVSFEETRKLEEVKLELRDPKANLEAPGLDSFLSARGEVFQIIRERLFNPELTADENRKARSGLVEIVDLAALAGAIERYAQSYLRLVEASMSPELPPHQSAALRAALASLDTIELRWRKSTSDPGRALLAAPTHPTRLLWHLAHTKACHDAAIAWQDKTREVPYWPTFLGQLSEELFPMNLPMVLFDRHRTFVERTPVTPFWPLYLPDRADDGTPVDAMAARDRALYHMGIRDRLVAVTTVSPLDIAVRLFDYLEQHPYVEQLRLNVLNPGDGRLVADVLRYVEEIRLEVLGVEAPSLRYLVHLFAKAEHLETTGDGLESLLDPDRQVGEEDEFTIAAQNHLLPKLVFAKHSMDELLREPDRFSAHVSLLIEQFTARGHVRRVDTLRRGSFVGGLVQEPESEIAMAGSYFGWVKGIKPTARSNADGTEILLTSAVAASQRAQAAFALGGPATPAEAPVVELSLGPADQSLIKQVHEVSDWVLTIDRSLGIDYFDSPSSARESGYLLDFAPEYLQEDRQRILLTTRSTIELESLIRPMLAEYGLNLQQGDEVMVLETLRSLSGRLALRLETASKHAHEVIGLLFARWLLDRLDLLEERIIIPLDAHQSWFSAEGQKEVSQQRADLLLVGLTGPQKLCFDVVEVKLRKELTVPERGELYRRMRDQTDNTVKRLNERFALDRFAVPRADSLLRAKELASALAFYARRAHRYRLLSDGERDRMLAAVEHLDEGYTIDLRTRGIVFDRRGSGSHIDDEMPGLTVHRFGGDVAKALYQDAMGRFAARSSREGDRAPRRGDTVHPPSEHAREVLDDVMESLRSSLSSRPPKQREVVQYVPPKEPRALRIAEPVAIGWPAEPEPPEVPSPAGPAVEGPAPTLLSAQEAPSAVESLAPKEPVAQAPPASPAPVEPETRAAPPPLAEVLLGTTEMTPQYGVIGKSGSHKVGIDLTGPNIISLFGVQGFGKSYTLGVIAEMAAAGFPGVNVLPSPLATVIFHYHKSDAYAPELATAVHPNHKASEVDKLLREYGATPAGLSNVVLLTTEAKVEARRREYPEITVEPIKFSSAELKSDGWKFLLGAYGNDALYLKQLQAILRRHRNGLTLAKLREELGDAELSKAAQRLAEDRIRLAEPYIDDARSLGALLRPGRTVIVDLRDEWIEKEEALELFVVMMNIFSAQKIEGRDFNKLLVFDEAHKYITQSELIGQVAEIIREMRHQATGVVIASQDPLSVPRVVIELSTVLLLHRMTSPQWLKHLKTALIALEDVEESHLSALSPGEALVWAQRATDKRFTSRPQKITIRPRVTQHGGGTKTAVAGATVR